MKKDFNLYELSELIKSLCDSHPVVNDFMVNVYRLNDTDNIGYPAVALTLNNATKRTNTIDFSVNLLYADRLTDSRDNTIAVQSSGITALLDIINAITEYTTITISDDYQMTPFEEQFADNTAGVYVPLSLKVPNYIGECTWIDPKCIDCK